MRIYCFGIEICNCVYFRRNGMAGNYCLCVPRSSCQSRQWLDELIFSDGWIPRTCLDGSAWLMVRAVAPYEAGILSLLVVLRKTRFGKNKPFQPRDMLQEVIFAESVASQSWLKKTRITGSSCGMRASPSCPHYSAFGRNLARL